MKFENFIEESMLTESNITTFPLPIEKELEELLAELDRLIDVCYGMRNAVNMREISSLTQWAKDIKVKASWIPESVSSLYVMANLLKIDIGQK